MARKKKIKGEKKILFLDYDGVLNSVAFFLSTDKTADMFLDVRTTFRIGMDLHNVKILNYILKELPDLEIIISSSWGHTYPLKDQRSGLVYAGLKKEYRKRIIGITPRKMSSRRCHEVLWAVRDLEEDGWICEKWLTLDDRGIFPESKDPEDHFGKHVVREIKTSPLYGLTIMEAWRIIKYFNPDFKEPNVYL